MISVYFLQTIVFEKPGHKKDICFFNLKVKDKAL